ncbi:MAG: serine/threonine protein kinase, partial [Thermoanaerobaculia bacterium]|nr:serine/threonine protein kinase [Thermoanaerobaculia bacterium]
TSRVTRSANSPPRDGVGRTGKVVELEGSKVLQFFDPPTGLPRATAFMGPDFYSNYTIQADLRGSRKGRKLSDLGLVNGGYTLDLQGAHQRLQLSSWISELRMAQQVAFAWEPDTWYTMKLRVEVVDDGKGGRKGSIRGKVWKRGDAEPAEWTLSAEDPLPIDHGTPGVYAFSPVDGFVDNLLVTPN